MELLRIVPLHSRQTHNYLSELHPVTIPVNEAVVLFLWHWYVEVGEYTVQVEGRVLPCNNKELIYKKINN